MIGNDINYLSADADMLHARGLNVYVCDKADIINDMVEEVKPDIIFMNWQNADEANTGLYHSLLDNIRFAAIPIIFTLAEDDVYLVNRKRTATKDSRYITCDNVIDAIKVGLTPVGATPRKNYYVPSAVYSNTTGAFRA
jgi:hypothetical protein